LQSYVYRLRYGTKTYGTDIGECRNALNRILRIKLLVNRSGSAGRWRRYDQNDPTSVEEFAQGYRNLIVKTKDKLEAKFTDPKLMP
jgi:hypothetical protein